MTVRKDDKGKADGTEKPNDTNGNGTNHNDTNGNGTTNNDTTTPNGTTSPLVGGRLDSAPVGRRVPLVCALLVDLDDTADFPGNEGAVFGRPISAYPLMAARTSAHVRRVYALTGSPAVKAAALQYDAIITDPPKGKPALLDYLRHGYRHIQSELRSEGAELELLVVLSANAPAVTKDMVDLGVESLLDRPELDSALSVVPLERWTPAMARREAADGLLLPYLAPEQQSEARAWYPSWGVCVLRPRCLETVSGQAPMPWLGQKVLPLKQWGMGPLDYRWQLPCLEYWLKKNGIPDLSPPLERQPLPKPQAAPKGDRR